jgi:succinate dehydrogenase / fumarate reductase flavoprotein subunit
MRIYPAVHYTMGGLWVDYQLMSNIPGLFVVGEANFSDHGANRLGASALMQGLADGYFVLPYTIGDYLAGQKPAQRPKLDAPEFAAARQSATGRLDALLAIKGKKPVSEFHRELGHILWNHCGMARNDAGLRKALELIPQLRAEFWKEATIPGTGAELNQALERANRVADFLELGELMVRDALTRAESAGCHFREEFQEDGECKRNDADFAHVAAWTHNGEGAEPTRNVEPLVYENIKLATRSYK